MDEITERIAELEKELTVYTDARSQKELKAELKGAIAELAVAKGEIAAHEA